MFRCESSSNSIFIFSVVEWRCPLVFIINKKVCLVLLPIKQEIKLVPLLTLLLYFQVIIYLVVHLDVIEVSHPEEEHSLISSKWWHPCFLLFSSFVVHHTQFKQSNIACIFFRRQCPAVESKMTWLLQLEFV